MRAQSYRLKCRALCCHHNLRCSSNYCDVSSDITIYCVCLPPETSVFHQTIVMYPPILRCMAFISSTLQFFTVMAFGFSSNYCDVSSYSTVCCACFSSNYCDVSSDCTVYGICFHQHFSFSQTIVMYPPIGQLWHLVFHQTIVMYPPIVWLWRLFFN